MQKVFLKLQMHTKVSNPDFGLLAQKYEEIIQDAKKQIRYPESSDS